MREIVVFSGSAHRSLAQSICAELGVELSSVEMTRFSNDCLQAQLQANCRQRDVYIVQPLVPPTQEHLMELLLMIDAARGRQRRPDHRGHPALRLRPVGQEGRLADLDRRPPGRRHARDRRRRPGADDDAARPAGARVLLGAGRPPHARSGCSPTTSGGRPHRRRRRLTRPRQRQDRHPVLPAARAAGRRGQQAAAGRRPGGDRRHRRRRGRQAGDRARRRDRHRRLHRRAARPARRRGLHASAAVACTHGLFVGKAVERLRRAPDDHRGGHDRHRPARPRTGPSCGCAPWPACSPRPSPASTPASRSAASSTGSTPRSGPRSPGCSTSAPAPGRGAPPGDPGRARR